MLNLLTEKKTLAAWAMVLGLAGAGVACEADDGGANDDVIIEDEQEGADLDPDIEDEVEVEDDGTE